jgi:PhoH-like ATPase
MIIKRAAGSCPFLLLNYLGLDMKKTYILDTNVLLSDTNSLFGFEEHDLVLPLIVLEELDRHKDRQDEVGRNAREFVRKLADLTKVNKDFKAGIPLGKKLGTLKILSIEDIAPDNVPHKLPIEMETKKSGDNIIAQFCVNYIANNSTETVALVTRDTILRLKAQSLGVACEDYRKFNVASSVGALYSGVKVVEREDINVDEFYATDGYVLPEDLAADMFPNQFVILKNGQKSAMARFINKTSPLKKLAEIQGKLTARNKEQEFARELLYDPTIKLVTLAGQAGTGKTLCAIDAGLEQVLNTKTYNSLVICRPVMPLGKDIGFLPGDLNEKLEPWLAPIKDNLRFLLGAYNTNPSAPSSKRTSKFAGNVRKTKFDEQVLQSYFDEGIIEVQALTFIRGRSIANAYIIIDETQNTNLHEIKTILTRVGENTKIVLTGDPEQIDNTYVDSVSNGLSIVAERFKTHSIAGHVQLIKGERSALATLASSTL